MGGLPTVGAAAGGAGSSGGYGGAGGEALKGAAAAATSLHVSSAADVASVVTGSVATTSNAMPRCNLTPQGTFVAVMTVVMVGVMIFLISWQDIYRNAMEVGEECH